MDIPRAEVDLAAALDQALDVAAERPVRVRHAGSVTLAGVSIAALRGLAPESLACWADVHLDDVEAARWRALTVRKRNLEWLAGRIAAKWAVVARARRATGEILTPRRVHVRQVEEGVTKGAPYVDASMFLSLAHSADLAVAATSASHVGVDVEWLRPVSEELVDAALTREERARVRGPDGVLLAWACKEALLKACAVGMRVPMRDVTVTLPAGRGGAERDGQGKGPFAWSIEKESCALAPIQVGLARSWAGILRGYAVALVVAGG